MRKILVVLAFVLFITSSFSGVAYAYSSEKDYRETLQYLEQERTDIYALDNYKYGPNSDVDLIVEQVKKITKGITNDYDKAKAIFEWLGTNMTYTYQIPWGLQGLDRFLYGTCVTFAGTTNAFMQAAGLPSKVITGRAYSEGTWGGHEWNRVYVDNRWIHVDTTWAEFDTPATEWAWDHVLGNSFVNNEKDIWDGTLYFYDIYNDKVLKEVKNFPLYGVIDSTYGFDINVLYLDRYFTEPFKLNTVKVDSNNCVIYVNPFAETETYTVKFNSNKGTSVKSLSVDTGSTITKPKNPTRKGYKFVAWYKDSKLKTKWNFSKDTVTKNTTLYAKWVKTYTVTFNSNKGTAVKSLTATNKSTITKPKNPTRKGYKFVAWYKDSALKTKWNFSKDTVTANTTLYAKWVKTYTVTFNSNKGSSVKAVTATNKSKISQPKKPTRKGYTFVGWYKDSKLKTKWNFDKDIVTKNTVLYAKWKKI